jgi:hypothetical protein
MLVTTKMMQKSFVQSYRRVDKSLQKASSAHFLKSELDQRSIRVLKKLQSNKARREINLEN